MKDRDDSAVDMCMLQTNSFNLLGSCSCDNNQMFLHIPILVRYMFNVRLNKFIYKDYCRKLNMIHITALRNSSKPSGIYESNKPTDTKFFFKQILSDKCQLVLPSDWNISSLISLYIIRRLEGRLASNVMLTF